MVEKFSKTLEIRVSKKIDRLLRMTINDDGVEVKLHNQRMMEKNLDGIQTGRLQAGLNSTTNWT